MLSRLNQRSQSLSRKKIIIPDIYNKNRDTKKSSTKRQKQYQKSRYSIDHQQKLQRVQKGNQNKIDQKLREYGTDDKNDKKKSHNSSNQYQHLKEIISRCQQCKNKVSEFVTKKPNHNLYNIQSEQNININTNNKINNDIVQKSTQTTHKPFLIDLIEQRVETICRQNQKMSSIIQQKDQEIIQKQQQLNQIQEKFTNIIYTLGQDLCYLKLKQKDEQQLKENLRSDTETPAYLKALLFDRKD